MQTLNLTPNQLLHLKQHGELAVWVPMKEQPKENWATDLHGEVQLPPKLPKCPYRLGERVELITQAVGTTFVGDKYVDVVTTIPVCYATLTTSPEPRRLESITEREAMDAGFNSKHVIGDEYHTPSEAMQHHHKDLTPSSYGWWFVIKKEG